MQRTSVLQACTAWLTRASPADLRTYVATGHRPNGTVDLRSPEARRGDAQRELSRRAPNRTRRTTT